MRDKHPLCIATMVGTLLKHQKAITIITTQLHKVNNPYLELSFFKKVLDVSNNTYM